MQPQDQQELRRQLQHLWDETSPPGGWDPLRARLSATGRGKGRARGRRGWLLFGLPLSAAAALAFVWITLQMFDLRARVAKMTQQATGVAEPRGLAGVTGASGEQPGGARGESLPPRPDVAEQASEFLALYSETRGFYGEQTRWLAIVEGDNEVHIGQSSNGPIGLGRPIFVRVELVGDDGRPSPAAVRAHAMVTPGAAASFSKELGAGRRLGFRLEPVRANGTAELRIFVEFGHPGASAVLSSLCTQAELQPTVPRVVGAITIGGRLHHVVLTVLETGVGNGGNGKHT